MEDKLIAYGGRGGGGRYARQLSDAYNAILDLEKRLKAAESERDRLAAQIAKVEFTDDPLTYERVIRIRYTDLLDEPVVLDAISNQLRNLCAK